MDVTRQKIRQAIELLPEVGLDTWIVFVRETEMMADPVLSMVVGYPTTWDSFYLFDRSGTAIALVGRFDEENLVRSGRFDEVLTYTASIREDFSRLIARLDPQSIGVNYSIDDPSSDGLTHGMYLLLMSLLENTPYAARVGSAETLISKLRSRKLEAELALLTEAAHRADRVWEQLRDRISVGMSEREIAGLVEGFVSAAGDSLSFPTIVNAGDKTQAGHSLPTDARLAPGDLMHIDFGVRHQGYCSDIQRLLYFRRPGETGAPAELSDAFEIVRDIITETGRACRPGVRGHEVDTIARSILIDHGYPVYEHALGHQLGRNVHDGGAMLGPLWERYGRLPEIPIEANNVFTLELGVQLPGIGCVELEEDMVVTRDGARFLSTRQMELPTK